MNTPVVFGYFPHLRCITTLYYNRKSVQISKLSLWLFTKMTSYRNGCCKASKQHSTIVCLGLGQSVFTIFTQMYITHELQRKNAIFYFVPVEMINLPVLSFL